MSGTARMFRNPITKRLTKAGKLRRAERIQRRKDLKQLGKRIQNREALPHGN